jgi:hypothetical protein
MKATIEKQKSKGGRSEIVLTDEQLENLKILSVICTTQQIADYFGICRDTFRQIRIRDEEVSSLYKKGRVVGHLIVASKLMDKIKQGDTTAMIFYLKTQSRWKEPTEEREEELIKTETPEEIEAKMDELRMYLEWKKECEEASS